TRIVKTSRPHRNGLVLRAFDGMDETKHWLARHWPGTPVQRLLLASGCLGLVKDLFQHYAALHPFAVCEVEFLSFCQAEKRQAARIADRQKQADRSRHASVRDNARVPLTTIDAEIYAAAQ